MIIDMREHTTWGDFIETCPDPHRPPNTGHISVVGWLKNKPSAGDILLVPHPDGGVGRFKLTDIRTYPDPPDMFTARGKFKRWEEKP